MNNPNKKIRSSGNCSETRRRTHQQMRAISIRVVKYFSRHASSPIVMVNDDAIMLPIRKVFKGASERKMPLLTKYMACNPARKKEAPEKNMLKWSKSKGSLHEKF